MTKRITITIGDYVLLSDIPNEQVFNLVKECFVNGGFIDKYYNTNWESKRGYLTLGVWRNSISGQKVTRLFYHHYETGRQLSLSDVFNSTNGGFAWYGNTVLFIDLPSGDFTAVVKEPDERAKPDTYKITKAFDIDNLQHMDISSVQGRVTGKSTAHHLGLISKAMKSPEQWVKVYSDYDNLERHNRWAFEEVRNLCHKLGLDWMEFSVSGNSIRYMPYQTVKMVTKWELV